MANPFFARRFPGLADRRDVIESVEPGAPSGRRPAAAYAPAPGRRADPGPQPRADLPTSGGWESGIRRGRRWPSISPARPVRVKTISAQAIAHHLGKRLLLVRYAELESMWVGEAPKNVAAIFRIAQEEDAGLFFDEADAIAALRSSWKEGG